MKMKSIEELAEMLIQSGIATPETIVGCSESEIAAVENHFNVRLPSSYKAYLRIMGKEMGDFGTNVIMTYPGIMNLCRRNAQDIAAKKQFDLLPEHFVFLSDPDVFMFFDTREEDPATYRLDIVADDKPLLVGNSFLEYLTSFVNDEIELDRQWKIKQMARNSSD